MKPIFMLLLFIIISQAEQSICSDKEKLKKHVSALVNTETARNYENTEILDTIARYIFTEFKSYGFTDVREQVYDVNGRQYRNVIASIGPELSERVVVGAHYDVYGDLPGADDNASGVAGLLECARLIHKKNGMLKNRIDFVAYTLEEPPFFRTQNMGSYRHASSLSDSGVNVKLMICLEMIGYFDTSKRSQSYPTRLLKPFYGSRGDYITCIANFGSGKYARSINTVFNKQTIIKSKCLISPSFIKGIDFSDHRNYWGYKMPAILITDTAFYRNLHYHTSDDTIEKLDFGKMAEVVNGVGLFLTQM
jgi:hypothetical protein